ncbi:Mid1p [Sporobolomyces koalae]|uniref:Mid1p n=1 Tax=Sporobolomyces koalae TaxID=500713 RepID=UPI003175239F
MIPRIPRQLIRRRPPRRLASSALLGVLLALVSIPFTASQLLQPVQLPSSSTFTLTGGTTRYFELDQPTSEAVYITLSVCAPPSDLIDSLPSLLDTTLYVSTDPTLQQPGPDNVPSKGDGLGGTSKLEFGAANVTLDGAPEGLWIGVTAPTDSETDSWLFELDLSSDVPLVTADGGAGFEFQDSDQHTALLATANWTDGQAQPSTYEPAYYAVVAPSTPVSYVLGRSKCFVQSIQNPVPARKINVTTTTRGYGSGLRTQFLVSDLQPSSNYTAWLVQNLTAVSDTTNATRLWDPIFFTTKSSSSCRLLYDLDYCPSIAYSVPAPSSLSTSDLVDYFNASITPSLKAFARTLTTFPCDSTEFGQYSVVSTCSDCYEAYRDWICTTTIPRCTDAPSNATLVTNSSRFDPVTDLAIWSIPSTYSSSIVRDYPPASRTPAFAPSNLSTTFPTLFNASYPASNRQNLDHESPFPYSEVLPCMDVCHLVDARCPTFLGWTCPTSGGTGTATYGQTESVPSHERVAGDVRFSSLNDRAQDRWGNVYCNAVGSDLKMAAQFVRLSSAAGSLTVPFSLSFVLLGSGLWYLSH